ncbi:alkaline phosphatase family protein [bacterium]|nr:alkaline phosphatase family protein [bacterium]
MTHRLDKFILVLADGARPDVMEELLVKGELPNISKHLVERGKFGKATSVFPTTTGPAYVPFLTGIFPGKANIPGIRWFNPKEYAKKGWNSEQFRSYVGIESFLLNSDLNPNFKTLFEIFPNSASVFNSVTRGVSSENELGGKIRFFYWLYAHWTHQWNFIDKMAGEHLVTIAKRDYKFSFVVFPGIDALTHVFHPNHLKVIKSYHELDNGIGKLAGELKKQGTYETTGILITADHGLTPTHTHFGIPEYFREREVRTLYHPLIFRRNPEVTIAVSGNAMANLYIKSEGKDWNQMAFYEELNELYIKDLLNYEAIELAISLSEKGEIVVSGKEGTGFLEQTGVSELSYKVVGKDPLELGNLPETMTFDESLELTFETKFPDSLVQLLQIFTSQRTGNLLLSASCGFDLREKWESVEHFSSHGALFREHILVPFVTSFKLNYDFIRTVDAFPMILELLGEKIPEGIDGRNLFKMPRKES